jgi:hypothetical protein
LVALLITLGCFIFDTTGRPMANARARESARAFKFEFS